MSKRNGTPRGRKEYFDLCGIRRKFHVVASRTKHVAVKGICVRDLAAADARALHRLAALGKARGRREDRVRAAPAVPCALLLGKNAHEHTGSAEAIRPSLRGGLPAYSALSSVTGLSCHRHLREVLLPANLTPASGCQDHTASPSATAALVIRRHRVHRIPPHVRDDHEPPLSSGETGQADKTDLPDMLSGVLPVGLFCRSRGCCRVAKRRSTIPTAATLPAPDDTVIARHSRPKDGVASARL